MFFFQMEKSVRVSAVEIFVDFWRRFYPFCSGFHHIARRELGQFSEANLRPSHRRGIVPQIRMEQGLTFPKEGKFQEQT